MVGRGGTEAQRGKSEKKKKPKGDKEEAKKKSKVGVLAKLERGHVGRYFG